MKRVKCHSIEPEFYFKLMGETLKFLKQRRSDLGGGNGVISFATMQVSSERREKQVG